MQRDFSLLGFGNSVMGGIGGVIENGCFNSILFILAFLMVNPLLFLYFLA